MANPWAQVRDQAQPLPPADIPPSVWASPDQPQMPAVKPAVTRVPTPGEQQIQHDQQALQKVQWQQANPWGTPENHPGKLGKLAHVFSAIGNIAGDVFAPNVMERIPGTQANMEAKEGELAHRLTTEQTAESENQAREAEKEHTEAATGELPANAASQRELQGAQTAHLEAETGQIGEPGPPEIHDTPMGLMAIDKKNATATPVTALGKPIGPKLETQVVQGIISHADGKPHSYLVDKQGNKIADLGEHYERPITVNNNMERREKGDVVKAYQPTLDSAERMNVMTESYEKAIKNHDQQAMLNLLANHLGMTMGLQKGSRLTKDIIHEAQQSQPWLQGIAAKFDKDGYLAGVTLSPMQMRQMVELGQSRYAEDAKKSRSTAQYMGATDDGPERVPGKATINYYLGLANGDLNKAKQIATEDGWTVK